jgi:adenosylhomocysteine nucleosidase
MIAVTFALTSESSAFLSLLQDTTRRAQAISGKLHGREVCVLHTGVGEASALRRVPDFLREQTPTVLLSSGFCGALREGWSVGDVLFAENFSSTRLRLPAAVKPGILVTASAMVDSLSQRQELARNADAVDMETEFIAGACATANVPLLSLRAISDSPSAPFPAPPEVLFDVKRQRTLIAPLVAYLIRHPAAVPRLLSFAHGIKDARQKLADTLAQVIREADV